MHVLASKRQGIFLCFCGLAGLFLCILPVYLGCFTLFLIKSSYLSKKKKRKGICPLANLQYSLKVRQSSTNTVQIIFFLFSFANQTE
jgi:hypothetical protein